MFMDLLSESAKKGGFYLSGNKDEPIFRGYLLPDHPKFLFIFYKLFQLRFIGLGMPLFTRPYLGHVRQEIIAMNMKHHTYTHRTFRLYT